MEAKKTNVYISYFFQLVAGVILVVAAIPKLTGQSESIKLFAELGIPETVIVIGVVEILAAVFLIFNFIPQIGAFLSVSVLIGAVIAHTTILGIVVNEDGGQLFMMLLVALFSSTIVLWLNRRRLPFIGGTF